TALVKTGTGTFSVTNKVGRTRKLNGMDVRAGLVEYSSGSHTVKIDGTSYTFTNANSYGATNCYSDATVSS
ncbi:MAG: hypothetical protein IKG80_00770, partial [Clostridia bacterium]|nr:hypothetical protein [Clostridia bacterium]